MRWTLHNRYSYARWQNERREDARYERWQENNPECVECGQREHREKMYAAPCGGDVCEECSGACFKCGERTPYSMMNWTDCGDHLICVDCDDRGGE